MTADMDIISIRDLKLQTLIGIHPWERLQKQSVILNLTLSSCLLKAGQTDDIATAIDYSAIVEKMVTFGESATFKLIEAFAEEATQTLFESFPVEQVTFSISKPGILPNVREVGVTITRQRV